MARKQPTTLPGHYYQLMKPGIVYGNALTVIAGYFLAVSMTVFHLSSLLGVVVGTSLVIGSACVINNIIDRKIDTKMTRTKQRALATGIISVRSATIYGVFLGIVGFVLLFVLTNMLTFWIGIAAYIFYVVLYGISKRRSEHGTLVGSVSGALPPVAGYTALTNHVDIAAALLFFILVFWQMAHFYAIVIYREKEYAQAKIPVLTVVRGVAPARMQIQIYIAGFIGVTLLFTILGFTGVIFAVVMVLIGLWWFVIGLKDWDDPKLQDKRARKLFGISLIVNLVMCLMIGVGGLLP